jgi:hypothetical protein
MTRSADAFKDEVWKHAAIWEGWVKYQIETLSEGQLSVNLSGFGAGVSGRIKDERIEEDMSKAHFDLLIRKDLRQIAEVEVAADRKYNWALSHKIPTRADKIERAKTRELPCYMVYVLTLEKSPLALWLPLKEIGTYGKPRSSFVENRKGRAITLTKNYFVPKEQWNKGLESLVKELTSLLGKERKPKS